MRDATKTQDFRVQLLDTSKDSTILTQNKYLNITQIFNTCSKYLRPTRQLKLPTSSRGLGLVQRLHYLVCYHGGLLQILIELIISAIRLCALPESIKRSRRPIKLHQPKYMSHVLSVSCRDKPFKGFGYFTKFPRQ